MSLKLKKNNMLSPFGQAVVNLSLSVFGQHKDKPQEHPKTVLVVGQIDDYDGYPLGIGACNHVPFPKE